VQPGNNSPTTQRASKPVMPQKTQPIQAFKPAADASKMVAIGSGSYEEDPCVICHEDMNASFDIVTLECGHRYHSAVRFIILRCCEGIENRFLQIMMKALKGFAILLCPIKTPSGHGKHHVGLLLDCFHMTSRQPYWCPKTMKRRPYWCTKPILWESNFFSYVNTFFLSIHFHGCWPRE